ncbi:MAG: hypothetical protein HY320_07530 [Armatimonadetes bacterium]|nr:hypothetical protein [Armatimonadota bacterium]
MKRRLLYRNLIATTVAVMGVVLLDGCAGSSVHRRLDFQPGVRVILAVDRRKAGAVDAARMEAARAVLENRITGLEVASQLTRRGEGGFELLLPAGVNVDRVVRILTVTAQLEFRWLKSVQSKRNPTARYRMEVAHSGRGQPGTYTFYEGDKPVPEQKILNQSPLILTGRDLEPTSAQDTDLQTGEIVVTFKLKPQGTRIFANFTRQHVDEMLAIVLDGKIIVVPCINEPITDGQGLILGGFKTPQEARDLAVRLNSGPLPAPLRVVKREKVGARLPPPGENAPQRR